MVSETSHYETCAERYGHLFPHGTRIEGRNPVRIFYPDHDERYAHYGPRIRYEFPDAVYFPNTGLIKRERDFADLTAEERKHLSPLDVRFAAKDIPVREAMKTAEFYCS